VSNPQDQNNDLNDRLRRWIYVSHGLANIEKYAIISVQEIGRLDCICIEGDTRICSSLGNETDISKNLLRDNDHFLFSKLWVLAAYELIRVISKHYRKKSRIIDKTLYSKIESVEKKFLRLRVPLAKFESAKHHEKTDFGFAHPMIAPKYGCGWIISKDLIITRRELSDELLIIFEEIRQVTEKK